MDMTTAFDKNLVMVVILQSISFVIRNTSPIGWVVILLYKACYTNGGSPNVKTEFWKMIQNYILSFFVIFLPIFGLSIWLDSKFYGSFTVVPYNFINVNVFEGLSQTFGADPPDKYISLEIPARFNIFFPVLVLGLIQHYYSLTRKHLVPYLVYYCVSILVFLSFISHKEPKFLLPIFPGFFLFIGQYLGDNCIKKRPGFVKKYVIFGVILEMCINAFFVHYHEIGAFVPMNYIKS
jgi:phosphatidylinositol glycan class B